MDIKEYLDKVNDLEVEDVISMNPSLILEMTNSLYKDNQRHKYSDILSYIISFENNNTQNTAINEDLLYLSIKLGAIQTYLESIKNENSNKLLKLVDHIELEINRKEYFEAMTSKKYNVMSKSFVDKIEEHKSNLEVLKSDVNKEQSQLDKMKESVTNATKSIETVQSQSNETTKKINDVYVQFITILGIFTAIVFALFGGISSMGEIVTLFSNSSISIYKATTIILLCSATMLNTLYLFVYLIGKLIDKPVGFQCKGSHVCKCEKVKLSCRIRNKHGVLLYINRTIVIISTIIVLAYIADSNQLITKIMDGIMRSSK